LHLHSTVSIKRWVVAYPFNTFIDLVYQICRTLIKQGQYSKYCEAVCTNTLFYYEWLHMWFQWKKHEVHIHG
jgi:hypothetical protein